ncbi:MAG: nitroreductase family deazaflavin-dependent oxidoreductase [Armatimonadetes bacterium]|nr:nitroreductase family deazaflavin-dependent oxidoreductase [Armatimonadota bacterium]
MVSSTVDRLLRVSQYLNLETTGRRTGRPHTVELSFVYDGEAICFLAGRGGKVDWVKNIRKEPRARVKVGGRVFPSRAEIARQTQVEHILEMFRDKYGTRYVKTWYESTARLPVRVTITTAAREGGRG